VRIVAARSAAAGCSDVSVLGRGVRGGAPMAVPWPNFFGSVGISACPLQGIKGTYKGAPPTCYIAVVAAAAPAAARAG
jgi:hypothetical protein